MRSRSSLALLWTAIVLSLLAAGPAAPAARPLSLYALSEQWRRCFPGPWCETGWYASPAAADIDADGQVEAVWGGYTLMSVNGLTGALEWSGVGGNRLWPGIVVADLTGNGSLEVVTASHGGMLRVYTGSGGAVPGWPLQVNGQSNELRTLAVSDLDGDDLLELIVATTNSPSTGKQHWYVYQSDGSLRPGWPRLLANDPGYAAGAYNQNVGVADLDHDGRGEIIGPSDVHYLSAFNDDGSQLTVHPRYTNRAYWSQVGVHVSDAVDVVGYANCGAQHRPNFASSAAAIGDLAGTGVLQVVVVGNVHNCGTSPYTNLYELPFVFNLDRTRWASGAYNWTAVPVPDAAAAPLSEDYSLIENSLPNPVLADLDGDGQQEILYASYDGRVHAYWLDKTEHGQWPFEVTPPGSSAYRFASEPVVADLNADGLAEVIFSTWTRKDSHQSGQLNIVSWDGALLQSIDLPRPSGSTWGGALGAPTLANLDADPNLEVLVGTANNGLVAYEIAGSANARLLWPTGRGSFLRTGSLPAGSLTASTKTVSPPRSAPGETLTYTLRLVNPGPLLDTVRLTDTLPVSATLVAGSLTASSGSWAAGSGTLTWTGPVTPGVGVTVTYQMTTSQALTGPAVLVNTAHFDNGAGHVLTRTAVIILDGLEAFLPLLRR